MGSGGLLPLGSRLSRTVIDRHVDSFSATDIQAVIVGTDKSTGQEVITKIGDIQTLSYSIHREAAPVRTLGRVNPKGYTKGTRTTAGTLIFATFNQRALKEVYSGVDKIDLTLTDPLADAAAQASGLKKSALSISDAKISYPTDAIPPFDIVLYFTSEGGNDSVMYIYRVEIVDEGQTFSVQDTYIEHTMQYVAGGISLLEKIGNDWGRSWATEAATFKNAKFIRRADSTGIIL